VASVAWVRWRTAPYPRAGVGVEPTGRHSGGQGDLLRGSEALPGKRLAAKQPPLALLEVAPAGALGDEGVLDTGVVGQPCAGGVAGVAGQVVGDHHDAPGRVGGLDRGQQLLVADRVAGRGGQGDRLPSATRGAPYTQVFSGPRPSSSGALTRCRQGSSQGRAGSCGGSPGRARRHRSPTSPSAGRCSRR
jgi:hypothetical protein